MMTVDDLEAIRHEVSEAFTWTADGDVTYVNDAGDTINFADDWKLMEADKDGNLRGDCEDHALYCSKLIKERHEIPRVRRILTYCVTETGEGHMVLEVRVGGRGYVIDNRYKTRLMSLIRLKRAGYTRFMQPLGSIAGKWREVKP